MLMFGLVLNGMVHGVVIVVGNDVNDVLVKTPGVYLLPKLRYPCHCCCCCPPPHRPPTHRHHHHETDALDVLDVLAKTPCLYQVPELRY